MLNGGFILLAVLFQGTEPVNLVGLRLSNGFNNLMQLTEPLIVGFLAFTKDGALLLTGLINPQVVRTADVGGLSAIVFVRGKAPSPEAAAMARELDIPLFSTPHTLFQACGILYAQGLAPCPPLAGKSLEE